MDIGDAKLDFPLHLGLFIQSWSLVPTSVLSYMRQHRTFCWSPVLHEGVKTHGICMGVRRYVSVLGEPGQISQLAYHIESSLYVCVYTHTLSHKHRHTKTLAHLADTLIETETHSDILTQRNILSHLTDTHTGILKHIHSHTDIYSHISDTHTQNLTLRLT